MQFIPYGFNFLYEEKVLKSYAGLNQQIPATIPHIWLLKCDAVESCVWHSAGIVLPGVLPR